MSSVRRYFLSLSRSSGQAAVSTLTAQHQGWITEAQHHVNPLVKRFFMRQENLADSLSFGIEESWQRFAAIAEPFQMNCKIIDSTCKKWVVTLVSKLEHCLYNLLARWQDEELDIELPCVISNHKVIRKFVDWHGIPFYYVPVTPHKKAEADDKIIYLFESMSSDLTVLTRCMQILSPEMCDHYSGQIINIHHSFLPSFVGAKPYHQTHERGVKLIGAISNYVTTELDAGPIIEQDTIRVDHFDSMEDLIRYSKDIEKIVLARGLRYHIEDQVLVNGNRTVVFR